MGDATSLRTLLSRVDATAPAIQSTAGAMMKHYDRSAEVAVVEWRNALHNSNRDQWLPLLYVANEVLQNSKRNRGNKFLEAFSPILGQSLIYLCQHSDAPVVEKVRRTCKIWAERHVFSIRFVNELLKGLEPYRNNRGATAPPTPSQQQQLASPQHLSSATSPSQGSVAVTTTPSPRASSNAQSTTAAAATTTGSTPGSAKDNAPEEGHESEQEEEEDIMDLLIDGNKKDDDDDDDDDDNEDVFGNSGSSGLKLDVELDFESTNGSNTSGAAMQRKNSGIKRRRSSTASTGSQSSASKKSRRKSVLSTTSLVELWKQVAGLEQSFDHSMALLKDITLPTPEDLESLVGDELFEHHKMIMKYQERVANERIALHRIATERKTLEQQAIRFIPWLEAALKQDQDDIDFCRKLHDTLTKFQLIHPAIREARDKRVAEDLRYQREQEEKERKRREEEESKRFRESALSKNTEAEPGMVWNKQTGEYQYLNTDESWRD